MVKLLKKEQGKRLRELREELNLTQDEFGKQIGKGRTTILKWEKGHKIPDPMIQVMHNVFSVDIRWLCDGEGKMFAKYHLSKASQISDLREKVAGVIKKSNSHPGIRVWAETGAGNRYMPDPDQSEPMEIIQIDNFLNPKYKDAFRVRGDSMYPLLREGALIFVDFKDKKPISNKIYVLYIPGEGLVVKTVIMQTKQVIIRSYNKRVPDDIIQLADLENNMIAGRVVLIHQELNG